MPGKGLNRRKLQERADRRRSIEMGYRISEWSGLTGLQCLYCGELHIDRAHSDGNYQSTDYQQARAAFVEKHLVCVKPTFD